MPRWWADAAGLAAGLSLAVVLALWMRNGGLTETAVGRLAGPFAADLLLLQVLLLARVPMVERAFGQDRLARWHRWVGFTSFHLLLATCGIGSWSTRSSRRVRGSPRYTCAGGTGADLAFRSELARLAAQRGIRVIYLLGPRAARDSWLPARYAGTGDVRAIRQLAPDITRHHLYICGPAAWADAVRAAARRGRRTRRPGAHRTVRLVTREIPAARAGAQS